MGWLSRAARAFSLPRLVALCATSLCALSAHAALIAEYRAEETSWTGVAGEVIDSSGNARYGSRLGTTSTIAGGFVCRGIDVAANTTAAFAGIDTGVNVSSSLGDSGTVSFWYLGNAAWVGSTHVQLLDASAGGATFQLSRNTSGRLVFSVTDTFGATDGATSAVHSFAAGTWVHVAVTWFIRPGNDKTVYTLYVNGSVSGTPVITKTSGSIAGGLATLHVGDSRGASAPSGGALNSANGRIDEVRLHDVDRSAAEVTADMNTTRSCTAALDHVEIRHASGSGVTCNASTLTLMACQDAACTTPYTGGVTGTLSATGSGMTVNWPGGASFSIPAGSSTVSEEMQLTTVGSVVLGISGASPAPSAAATCNFGSPSCTFTAADSGFVFDVPNHVSEVLQTVSISAVRKSDNAAVCVPAFANVSKSVTFSCAYQNPVSGTLPARVGGSALNASNSTAAACDAGGRAVSLAFNAGGVASTTLQYADVGQLQLSARFAGTGSSDTGLVMTGSDSFIAAPASFGIGGISAGPIKAGIAFAASVTARNSSGGTTPNFGAETAPQSATLAFTRAQPTGSGASDGVFSGSLGAFSAGVATTTNLVWSEVGRGDLTAGLTSGDYLGSGFSASGTTSNAGAVGRFIAHHFDVVVTPACGSFSYAAQPFTVRITAKNGLATPGTTLNYDGSAATAPNFAQAVTLSDAPALGVGSFGSTAAVAPSAFSAGVATTSTPAYSFTNKLTAAQTLVVRAIDADAASSAGYAEGSTALRSGRLRMSNAFGSEKAPLAMTLQAQYWSGNAWVANAADSCSVVPAAAVVRSAYFDNRGSATAGWTTTPSAISVVGGSGTLTLSAPSPAVTGSVDLALNLGATATDQSCLAAHPASTGAALPWLRAQHGNCSAAWDRDPAARASFGIYAPETRKTLHVREIF